MAPGRGCYRPGRVDRNGTKETGSSHPKRLSEPPRDLEARYPERAAYIAAGSVEVLGQRFEGGQLLVFAPGTPIVFTAVTDTIVMLLGGDPIGERFIEWNFVSSSRDRIDQAKADWRAGRMKLPVHDDAEFIPLPIMEIRLAAKMKRRPFFSKIERIS